MNTFSCSYETDFDTAFESQKTVVKIALFDFLFTKGKRDIPEKLNGKFEEYFTEILNQIQNYVKYSSDKNFGLFVKAGKAMKEGVSGTSADFIFHVDGKNTIVCRFELFGSIFYPNEAELEFNMRFDR